MIRVIVKKIEEGLIVDDGGGSISIDDNSGSLTIDDGGGSITVDGIVAVTADPDLRRLAESNLLRAQAAFRQAISVTEQYGSERWGFELRGADLEIR